MKTVQAIAPTRSGDHNRQHPSWDELVEDETFFRLFSADKEDVTMADSTRRFNLFPAAIVLLAALVLHLPPQSAVAAGPEPLTTAAAIARSVVAETDEPPPVSLEAVVTHRDAAGTIFLEDATGSTFISGGTTRPRFARGERVRVEGVVHRGLFINGIRPSQIEPLAAGPPPDPRPITPQIMAAGTLHYAWVSLEGVGRALRRTGEDTATLLVNVAGSIVEARFEQPPTDDDAAAWIGARLRLAGIAISMIVASSFGHTCSFHIGPMSRCSSQLPSIHSAFRKQLSSNLVGVSSTRDCRWCRASRWRRRGTGGSFSPMAKKACACCSMSERLLRPRRSWRETKSTRWGSRKRAPLPHGWQRLACE